MSQDAVIQAWMAWVNAARSSSHSESPDRRSTLQVDEVRAALATCILARTQRDDGVQRLLPTRLPFAPCIAALRISSVFARRGGQAVSFAPHSLPLTSGAGRQQHVHCHYQRSAIIILIAPPSYHATFLPVHAIARHYLRETAHPQSRPRVPAAIRALRGRLPCRGVLTILHMALGEGESRACSPYPL
jgi:hypothetical protein